jgi:CARDB
MRSFLVSVAALLVAAPGAAAAPSGTVPLLECASALEPAARVVTWEGRMRQSGGSTTMQMRFTLQARTPDSARWRRLEAAGFEEWLSSVPGVRRYSYAKTVRNLVAPATYRTTVRFRWLDASGAVLARSSAVSPTCTQEDLRPDLVPRALDVLPGADPGLRRYAIVVRNAGGSASGASALRLDVSGGRSASADVPPLAPGETTTVAIAAPACVPGDDVAVVVDPAGAVDESDEDGNVLAVPCPVVGDARPGGSLRGDG